MLMTNWIRRNDLLWLWNYAVSMHCEWLNAKEISTRIYVAYHSLMNNLLHAFLWPHNNYRRVTRILHVHALMLRNEKSTRVVSMNNNCELNHTRDLEFQKFPRNCAKNGMSKRDRHTRNKRSHESMCSKQKVKETKEEKKFHFHRRRDLCEIVGVYFCKCYTLIVHTIVIEFAQLFREIISCFYEDQFSIAIYEPNIYSTMDISSSAHICSQFALNNLFVRGFFHHGRVNLVCIKRFNEMKISLRFGGDKRNHMCENDHYSVTVEDEWLYLGLTMACCYWEQFDCKIIITSK